MNRFLAIFMCLTLLLTSFAFAEESTGPIIETTHGDVQGAVVDGVEMFKGIPYGADTGGENRFQAPQPIADWEGVFDATQTAPIAYQNSQSISASWDFGVYFSGSNPEVFGFNGVEEEETEDCLVLSIVTPKADDQKRPVIVYLHGGGYSTGSGALVLGGTTMVKDEDVVLVGVNHRLNVFGYLYLGAFDDKYADSGMAGILDIVLALEWVRDNIASFGGDPNNVTIMGESGGGGKVCTLLAMPEANGLFHKAIVESGASTAGTYTKEAATEVANKFLANLGITSDELDKLSTFTTEEIFAASQGIGSLRPVADEINLPVVTSDEFVVPEISKDIPIIVGASDDESGSGATPEAMDAITWENLPATLVERGRGVTEENVEAVIEAFRKYNGEDASAAQVYYNIISNSNAAGNSAHQMARARAVQEGAANIYQYLVSFDSQLALYPGDEYRLAWHTADLPLQFRIVYYPEAEELSKLMSGAIAAFARTGDPSTDELAWPAFTLEEQLVMVWDEESKVVSDPMAELRVPFQ